MKREIPTRVGLFIGGAMFVYGVLAVGWGVRFGDDQSHAIVAAIGGGIVAALSRTAHAAPRQSAQ